MSKKTVIAEIKLAPGEVGYYDDYSRIYLSVNKPSALVYAGTNCTQIKRSIKSGRLRLVSGGFNVVPDSLKEEIKKNESVQIVKPVIKPEVQVEEIVKEEAPVIIEEEVKVEETPAQEVEEVVAEAPIVEEEKKEEEVPAPRKRNRNKKSEIKVEEATEE